MFNFLTIITVSGIFNSIFGQKNEKGKAHFEQARVFFDQKKYDEAIIEYKAAIADNPHFDNAYVECADAFLMTNDLENTGAYLRKAIEINPKNAKAHNNLGCWYILSSDDKEQAESEFIKAAELDPKYTVNVGSTKSTRPVKIVKNFSEDKTFIGDLCDNQGVILQKLKQYQEAIILHERALKYGTSYPSITFNNLGRGYYNIGDFEQAIFYYDKALEIDPNNALAIKNRELAANKLDTDETGLLNRGRANFIMEHKRDMWH